MILIRTGLPSNLGELILIDLNRSNCYWKKNVTLRSSLISDIYSTAQNKGQ